MIMRNFITCFLEIILILMIFLQHHLVVSSSRIHQKTALFHFKQSLTISAPTICYYDFNSDSYEIPSSPKTMNWSMSSDHCTWEGVTCQHKTGHVIGLDLSCSQLEGAILPNSTLFKAMMNGDVNKIERSYMEQDYYRDSTGLVIKGVEIVLERILTVFTTIDLSRNNFEGEIPEYIGNLVSLRFLNLSYNHLTGHIPPSIAKLTVLESLDLSSNQLEGEIPKQLTGLYSLALLNLSYNQLRGHIPQGSQFDTFENDSYVGNLGLCGNPVTKKCGHDNVTQEEGEEEDNGYFFSGFTWKAVVIGYGCGVVPAFIIGNLMLLSGKPKWFAGIIARELGLKIRRMEIHMR